MKEELDHIDLAFKQKLSGFSVEETGEGWSMIAKKVAFRNFFKFSIVTVNIYYLVVALAFAGVSTATIIQNHKLKSEVRQLKENIQKTQQSEEVPESQENTNSINPASERENTKDEKASVRTSVLKNENIAKPENQTNVVLPKSEDSLKQLSNPQTQTDTSQTDKHPEKRIVRKKVVVKEHPVIIRDTVVKFKNVP